MLAGRASVYDNDYYLSATYPPALASNLAQLTPSQRASMSIMHVFVQCPRLNCLVRYAIMHPEDIEALASAVTLTEYMWQIDLPSHVVELIQAAVDMISAPPSLDMADVLTETLHFDSVQSMVLCTRYWMLQNVLCGLTDTLQRYFPTETGLSLLPKPVVVRQFDTDAGIRLAESLSWAESVSQRLPLVPLRLHTPLQISIGPWHRTIRDMAALFGPDFAFDVKTDQQASVDLNRAVRMQTWLINECNRIHEQWDVSTVDEKSLYEALDSMAGEQIPDWLPTRVRFEAEDGDMVIKLDYEKPIGNYQNNFSLAGGRKILHKPGACMVGNSILSTNLRGDHDNADNAETFTRSASVEKRGSSGDANSPPPDPADFLFQSGRNLCSASRWWPTSDSSTSEPLRLFTYAEVNKTFGPCTASSWWPQTPKSSVVLLDSTHKTSAFQPKARPTKAKTAIAFDNRNVNGCVSPAWNNTGRSAKSSVPSNNGSAAKSTSPEWSGGM